jgi:HD-GYP domain-containing protein (c-di-GMP phosphodiesterase class II)/DNA-binding CsgD family transcriptional regulator
MSLDPPAAPDPGAAGPPAPPAAESPAGPELRLVELVAAFSLVSDLALGHPPDEVMRACLLATALAREDGLPEPEVADVYWTTLLAHSGCTAFAHEQAALLGGDDIAVNALGTRTDFNEPREAFAFLRDLVRGRSAPERLRIVFGALTAGKRFDEALATANCEVAATLAARVGLDGTVEASLLHLFERWDGKGAPAGLRGEEIARPARFAELAHQAAVFARMGGMDAAVEMVERRAGGSLDPALAASFVKNAASLAQALDAPDPWSALLAAEPSPGVRIQRDRLGDVAAVFADIVDLKSPTLLGHSRGVAALAEGAAREAGLARDEVEDLHLAALLHDLGRAAVPSGIWEKAGPLTQAEWERVRLHAYHSERLVVRAPALARLGAAVGMHHERLDGSGYHRGLAGPVIGLHARVLAAADAFQAMTETRRHREALDLDAAADRLAADAEAGRLDRGAVEAVLAAAGAGRRRPGRPSQVGPLTEREVEVLCLIARGLTNREVGRRLFVSPKTVGRHVEHIYGKLGIRSRAAAALYASTHGLVDPVP